MQSSVYLAEFVSCVPTYCRPMRDQSFRLFVCCAFFSRNGKSRRFGFIGYKTAKAAKAAQKFFHQTFIGTSKIDVTFANDVAVSSIVSCISAIFVVDALMRNMRESQDMMCTIKRQQNIWTSLSWQAIGTRSVLTRWGACLDRLSRTFFLSACFSFSFFTWFRFIKWTGILFDVVLRDLIFTEWSNRKMGSFRHCPIAMFGSLSRVYKIPLQHPFDTSQ